MSKDFLSTQGAAANRVESNTQVRRETENNISTSWLTCMSVSEDNTMPLFTTISAPAPCAFRRIRRKHCDLAPAGL